MSAYVRRAERSDKDSITRLWLDLLAEQSDMESRFAAADDVEERWRNDYERWLEDETRRIFVVERDGSIEGFVTARRWAPAPVYAFSEEVYLNELYVRPEARREGLGRRLVMAVQNWADELGAERMRMNVLAANEQGRVFWSSVGARQMTLTYAVELESSAKKQGRENKRGKLGF